MNSLINQDINIWIIEFKRYTSMKNCTFVYAGNGCVDISICLFNWLNPKISLKSGKNSIVTGFEKFEETMKFAILAIVFLQGCINAELIISKAERTIDLGSQLVKVSTVLNVFNKGSSVNEISIAVEEDQNQSLAFIEASVSWFV